MSSERMPENLNPEASEIEENEEQIDVTEIIDRIEKLEEKISSLEEKILKLEAFEDRIIDCEDSIDALGAE